MIFRIKFNDNDNASQTAGLYGPHIFRTWKNTYLLFFQLQPFLLEAAHFLKRLS